jgi:hypothetical protein
MGADLSGQRATPASRRARALLARRLARAETEVAAAARPATLVCWPCQLVSLFDPPASRPAAAASGACVFLCAVLCNVV